MSPFAALPLVTFLFAPPPASHPAQAVAATDGSAWAVVHAAQLWVCWDPAPRCFERVALERPALASPTGDSPSQEAADPPIDRVEAHAELDPDGTWRLGFDQRRLWITLDGHHYRVEPGRRRATLVEQVPPQRLTRPRIPTCGPRSQVPAFVGASLGWRDAPRCAPVRAAETCRAPRGPKLRAALPLELRTGVELVATHAWSARRDAPTLAPGPRSTTRRAHVGLFVFVELGFDLGRATRTGPSRALGLRERALRSVPEVPDGPLAGRERAALRDILCVEDSP